MPAFTFQAPPPDPKAPNPYAGGEPTLRCPGVHTHSPTLCGLANEAGPPHDVPVACLFKCQRLAPGVAEDEEADAAAERQRAEAAFEAAAATIAAPAASPTDASVVTTPPADTFGEAAGVATDYSGLELRAAPQAAEDAVKARDYAALEALYKLAEANVVEANRAWRDAVSARDLLLAAENTKVSHYNAKHKEAKRLYHEVRSKLLAMRRVKMHKTHNGTTEDEE